MFAWHPFHRANGAAPDARRLRSGFVASAHAAVPARLPSSVKSGAVTSRIHGTCVRAVIRPARLHDRHQGSYGRWCTDRINSLVKATRTQSAQVRACSSSARCIFSSIPTKILGKFGDMGPCEEEAILAVLVRRTREKFAICESKCLVTLNCKQVQQFRSRI
jgi:hypothetical protein